MSRLARPREATDVVARDVSNAELEDRRRATAPPDSWWTRPTLVNDRRAFQQQAWIEQPRMAGSRFGRMTMVDSNTGGHPPLSNGVKFR
jgi:hypothetical protein